MSRTVAWPAQSVRREPDGGLWREFAACRAQDAARFTPEIKPQPDELARLAGVCRGCPVIVECRAAIGPQKLSGFVAGRWLDSDHYGRPLVTRPESPRDGSGDD